MVARRAGQGGDTEDRENIEDHLSKGKMWDRPEEEAAAGNTNDCDEISTII